MLLAATSGAVVWGLWSVDSSSDFDNFISFFGIGGAAFAICVLFPHIRWDRFVYWRAVGVILLSITAWIAAYNATIATPSFWTLGLSDVDWRELVPRVFVGSVVGAVIVLVGTPLIAGLNWSSRYLQIGVPAALLAGAPFVLTSMIDEEFRNLAEWWGIVQYSIWHMTMAGVLHIVSSEKSLS